MMIKCIRCDSENNIIHHHEKYKELHGEDKVVLLCRSCHEKLHYKLRRDGKCNVSPSNLQKYSSRAHWETDYHKKVQRKYRHETIKKMYFYDIVDTNIRLYETIDYNNNTGHITISSYFSGRNKRKIINMDIGVQR